MRFTKIFMAFSFLAILAPATAMSQSDMGLKGVGLELGMVDPENIGATFGFALLGDFGTITPNFQLEGNIGYWSKSEEVVGGKSSISDITFGAKGKYVFETNNPSLRPFAGAGLGLHYLRAEATFPDLDIGGFIIPGMSVDDSQLKLGLDLGGGLATSISEKADFIGEMWYSLVSDVNQLSLKVGFMYKLGI